MRTARAPASAILRTALLVAALGGGLATNAARAQSGAGSPGGAGRGPAGGEPTALAAEVSPAIRTAEAALATARADKEAAYAAVEALVVELQDDYEALTTGPDAASHVHILVQALQDSLPTARTRLLSEAAKGKAVLRGSRRTILLEAFADPVAQAAPVDRRLCAWIAGRVADALSAREDLPDVPADELLGLIRSALPPGLSWYRFWNDHFHAGLPETEHFRKAEAAYEAAGLQLDRLRNPERYGSRGQEAPPGMVIVPGGSYELGPDTGWERPARRVTFRVFAIDRHEVTQGEFALFVNALPDADRAGALPRGWMLDDKGLAKYDAARRDQPVVFVDWSHAAAYAAWAGKRLPTEDEWEAAAAGVDGRIYPWGDEWRPACAVGGEEGQTLMPVESCPDGRAACGALDLAGNVWEWTSTLESGDDVKDVPEGLVNVVVRGGGWNDRREELTTRYRWTAPGHDAFASARYTRPIGFRCVKDLP